MLTLTERLEGGLVGLLVGDALGVPYEFHDPHNLPQEVTMDPPKGFARSHASVPPGTWSDDGAQALALLDSLLACNGLNDKHLAGRLCAWLFEAAYTPDGRVFDVGIQTRRALEIARVGGLGVFDRPLNDEHESSQGNGSLMRSLPIALWYKGDRVLDLVNMAFMQSAVTHWHLNAHVCVAIYVLWAKHLLAGAKPMDGWLLALKDLDDSLESKSPARQVFVTLAQWTQRPTGTGYVIDSIFSARDALVESDDYESAVRMAISFGHDTDTTACIAGGLAGILYGNRSIPREWRSALRGREVYRPLLEDLIAWRQTK